MNFLVINVGGLIALLYLWYNHYFWGISINENNIISPFIIKFLNMLPNYLITITFILIALLYFWKIIRNTRSFYLYMISLLLFHIIGKISLNILMLENTIPFILFEIHVPINEELKCGFFSACIYDAIQNIDPTILSNDSELDNFKTYIQSKVNVESIKVLNAKQIQEQAYELVGSFSEKYSFPYGLVKPVLYFSYLIMCDFVRWDILFDMISNIFT